MHVCHFCGTNVDGHYFKNISEGLVRKGVEVSCLELGSYKPPKWLNEVPQVKYFNLGITKGWQYPLGVWRLTRLLRREKIDILQTHLYNAGLIGVLAKRIHFGETIVALTRHHTSVVKDLGQKYHVWLDRWMAKKADYAIGVSEATRQYMIQVDKIRADHIKVVYHGFDFERFDINKITRDETLGEFGLSEKNFVIGYVANFAPNKGHLQLIRAFAKIIEQIPEARLLFVGSGSLAEVDAAIKDLELQDKVVFTGWRDDVAVCFSAMDLFVQPSLSEAFSQVLIEAMGSGLPVIATDVGGAKEVIDNGENAILIQPNDVDAIAENIIKLYRQKELRERLAEAGKGSVRSRFTVENMVNRQFELYKNWSSEVNGSRGKI